MAATFRIASSQIIKTVADHRLPSTDSILTMLKWVERHFMGRKPRANSLTYKNSKMDTLSMHMSFQAPSSPSSVGSNSDPEHFEQA
jgi:trehalose 6-phosphate synthase/phosphatase